MNIGVIVTSAPLWDVIVADRCGSRSWLELVGAGFDRVFSWWYRSFVVFCGAVYSLARQNTVWSTVLRRRYNSANREVL